MNTSSQKRTVLVLGSSGQIGKLVVQELEQSPDVHVRLERWYAEGGVDFMRQVSDSRMGYIGTIRDDIPYVLGRPALRFREWASAHKDEFIKIASTDAASITTS